LQRKKLHRKKQVVGEDFVGRVEQQEVAKEEVNRTRRRSPRWKWSKEGGGDVRRVVIVGSGSNEEGRRW